jgi:hypothetical protein
VWGPLVGLTAFVAFVFATSYVTANGPRATLQAWDQAVDKARAVCADSRYGGVYIYTWSSTESTVTPVPVGTRMPDIAPTRGPVLVPCDRLR